jgi:uncharacterized repeat protein (TIGR01451 family)
VAALNVTKTDGASSVVAGTPDSYAIVVSNTGPSTASNVSLLDSLPAQGLTNITSPNLPPGVTFNPATDGWTVSSLAPGQSVNLTLAGTVPSAATGTTYSNTVTASASDASTVQATDVDTLVTQSSLSITNSDGVSSVVAGTADSYTIVVSNTGPSDAAPLTVADSLPAQGLTTITSPNLPAGASFNSATDSWSLASLPSGQSVTLTLSGTVPSGATGSTYADTATASATDAFPVSATDTDTLTTQASLTITKTDNDGGSSVSGTVGTTVPGNAITYTIVASNVGPSDASNLSVVDTLPTQGLTGISSPNLPIGVTFNPSTDSWTATSLAAGHSLTLTLTGTVPPGATGTLLNSVEGSAVDAPTVSAIDSDTLSPKATLTITKSDNDGGSSVTSTTGTVVPGTAVTYTIVASNAGPSTATGASVTDGLGLNPDVSSDAWTATGSPGTAGSAPPARGAFQTF